MDNETIKLAEHIQNECHEFIDKNLDGSTASYADKMNVFFFKKIAELQERIETLELKNSGHIIA